MCRSRLATHTCCTRTAATASPTSRTWAPSSAATCALRSLSTLALKSLLSATSPPLPFPGNLSIIDNYDCLHTAMSLSICTQPYFCLFTHSHISVCMHTPMPLSVCTQPYLCLFAHSYILCLFAVITPFSVFHARSDCLLAMMPMLKCMHACLLHSSSTGPQTSSHDLCQVMQDQTAYMCVFYHAGL